MPAVGGNTAALIGDYMASIDAMADEIDTATRFVNVEFYIASFDATTKGFFAAMERAVQRGVPVRLLMDFIASRNVTGHDETVAPSSIGSGWSGATCCRSDRSRASTSDPTCATIASSSSSTVSSGTWDRRTSSTARYNAPKNLKRGLKWQELVTRVTGPIVPAINGVFLSDWYIETVRLLGEEAHLRAADVPPTRPAALDCQVVPSGPGYDDENNLRQFLTLVTSAQRKVIITSPYFVPDEAMMYAITSACKRGLEVQLFVSEISDQGPCGTRSARTTSRCFGPACRSGCIRRRSSCTRSTCRSTRMSR